MYQEGTARGVGKSGQCGLGNQEKRFQGKESYQLCQML